MKNIAQKAAVALSFLTLGANAKGIEKYNAAKLNTHDTLSELSLGMATENAKSSIHKATDINFEDAQNPAKLEQNLDGDPPTPEEIKAANKLFDEIVKLKNRDEVDAYITQNKPDWNKVIINLAIKKLEEERNNHKTSATNLEEKARGVKGIASDEAAAKRESALRKAAQDQDNLSYLNTAMIGKLKLVILEAKNALNITSNAEMIGLTTMDKTFADIIANDPTPEKQGERPDLVNQIFAGFSPEVQKAFNDMNLKMVVKKSGERIFVYVYYGTEEKEGEMKEAKVKFLDSRRGSNKIYLVERDGYSGVIASKTEKSPATQEIREKNGIIELVLLREDGSVKHKEEVKKNAVQVNSAAVN